MNNSIVKNVILINRNLNYYYNKILRIYNIKMSHLHLLHHIYSNEGINQSELAEKMGLDKITITKQIDKLVKEGYLLQKTDREDRRFNRIYTTSLAKKNHNEFKKIIDNVNNTILKGFNDNEKENIQNHLDLMSNNVINIINKE